MNKKPVKNIKRVKKQKKTESINLIETKKLRNMMLFIFLVIFCVISRILWIQTVQGAELQEKAYRQQTVNTILTPKRGAIYDSQGKVIAMSASVDTVSVNPTKIDEKQKEVVAKAMSNIFELEYEVVLENVKSEVPIKTIVSKVDKTKTDELKLWMETNKKELGKSIAAINIDEDSKRYYPYSNLASSLVGFTGSDNQGLAGIEYKWDKILKGTLGKNISSKTTSNDEIPGTQQTHIPAENGSDLILTIDTNIQAIAEKYLKKAVDENNCKRGGNVIIINPKTGEILAMADYPDYNLNTPFEANTKALQDKWDTLSAGDKNNELQSIWRNKNVSDTYEPRVYI